MEMTTQCWDAVSLMSAVQLALALRLVCLSVPKLEPQAEEAAAVPWGIPY